MAKKNWRPTTAKGEVMRNKKKDALAKEMAKFDAIAKNLEAENKVVVDFRQTLTIYRQGGGRPYAGANIFRVRTKDEARDIVNGLTDALSKWQD